MGRFEEVKDKTNFGMTATDSDISMTANKWNEIGRLTVGAQTAHQFGVGVIKNGVDSRETATIKVYACNDEGQFTNGKLRLRVSDANENREETVILGLLSEWNSGKKVGLSDLGAREDDILKVEIFPNVSSTLNFGKTPATASGSTTQCDVPVTTTTRR